MVLVILGLVFCPRKYTSDAKLFVRVGRESVALDPTVTTGQIMRVDTSREAEINSLLEVVQSRKILGKVVDEHHLDARYTGEVARDKAIIKLKKSLTIASPKRSNVIALEYESDSPQKSQKVVDTLVREFLSEHLRVNSTPGSYEFFERQTAKIKTELDEATGKLRDAKIEFQIGSINSRRQTLQTQIGENEQQSIDNETALSAVKAKIEELKRGLQSLPGPLVKQFVKGLPADAANNMREHLYTLQTREQELLARFTESHPQIIAIRDQVRAAEKIFGSEHADRGQITSAVLLTEMAIQKSLEAKRKMLGQHAERLHAELGDLNRHEVTVIELERQMNMTEAKFGTYTRNLEQARISRELKKVELTNISVIQPASLVLKPSSPRKALTLILGFVFAVVGAIAVSFVSDNLSRSANSPATASSQWRETTRATMQREQQAVVEQVAT